MRRAAVAVVLISALAPQTAFGADPNFVSTTQLAAPEQALGWWLGGVGVASMLVGGFALAIAGHRRGDAVHDLTRASGTALLGLGAAALGTGIFVMAAGPPGPCEMHGTAHDGVEVSLLFNGRF